METQRGREERVEVKKERESEKLKVSLAVFFER
jgi:hypothetical protein